MDKGTTNKGKREWGEGPGSGPGEGDEDPLFNKGI